MRVITGVARGRRIKTLEGYEVRPTTEKVKEAVFSSIQFEIEAANVLDLFCGCGQMGIEALSRGAKFCVFVDNAKSSVEIVKENLKETDLFQSSRVVNMNAEDFVKTTKDKFDVVFMDPPYLKELIQKVLPELVEKMNEGGVILCEHDFKDALPEEIGNFRIKKTYKYGRVSVTAYRKK